MMVILFFKEILMTQEENQDFDWELFSDVPPFHVPRCIRFWADGSWNEKSDGNTGFGS